MIYKKIIKVWLTAVLIGLMGIFITTVVVDSLNLLGMPIINGINNYKDNQDKYIDVFKPYEIIEYKPKVIFVGSSRIYQGIYPNLFGYDDSQVYNLGCSSLSFKDMEKYLDFVYEVQKPKKVFVGLDFFQFSKNNYNELRNGFSTDRLMRLAKATDKEIKLLALKDNFQVNSEVIKTIKQSIKK